MPTDGKLIGYLAGYPGEDHVLPTCLECATFHGVLVKSVLVSGPLLATDPDAGSWICKACGRGLLSTAEAPTGLELRDLAIQRTRLRCHRYRLRTEAEFHIPDVLAVLDGLQEWQAEALALRGVVARLDEVVADLETARRRARNAADG